jgi:hypothetical protein
MAVGRYFYVNRKACRAKKGATEKGSAPLKHPKSERFFRVLRGIGYQIIP